MTSDFAIHDFGDPRTVYRGTGTLRSSDGEYDGGFSAAPLHTGEILIVFDVSNCAPYFRTELTYHDFKGETEDGWRIEAIGRLHARESSTTSGPEVLARIALDASALRLYRETARRVNAYSRPEGEDAASPNSDIDRPSVDESQLLQRRAKSSSLELRYGVTNFEFTGLDARTIPNGVRRDSVTFQLDDSATAGLQNQAHAASASNRDRRVVQVVEVPDYDRAVKRLKRRRGTQVTAEIRVPLRADLRFDEIPREIEQSDATIDVLVRVLSVARGTKIQWVSRDLVTTRDEVLERFYATRITRGYCPLPLIPPMRGIDTVRFVEAAYPRYLAYRGKYRLDATTDAYLDAKSDVDFSEMRAAKLAVALEALKHAFAEHMGADASWLLPSARVEAVAPEIRKTLCALLKDVSIEKDVRHRVADLNKVKGLFRKSFKDLVRAVFADVGLPALEKSQLDFFVESRNSLVHTGRFVFSEGPPSDGKKRPAADVRGEFHFDLAMLDGIFGAVLGVQTN